VHMLIFTLHKSFDNLYISMIQQNAILSWTNLNPRPSIMLSCEAGSDRAAEVFGCKYVVSPELNDAGIPLVRDIFYKAQTSMEARELGRPICYVNADIMLTQSIVVTAGKVSEQLDRFLVVGRRWNWGNPKPLSFHLGAWDGLSILQESEPNPPVCIDYFLYKGFEYKDLGPFAIGAYAWDPYLMWKAHGMGVPVIDASDVVVAIHQDHRAYRHPRNTVQAHKNRSYLPDEVKSFYSTDHAPYVLTENWEIEER
jgi:hypothetical protein